MTSVYELAVLEGHEWALPADERDFEVFRSLGGARRAADWTPVRMHLLRSDEGVRLDKYSDFPWLNGHTPVLRPPSVEALAALVARDAELLPLACEEAELHVLNPCTVIDALDVAKSRVVPFAASPERFMTIRRHVFRPEDIGDAVVFTIPQLRAATFFTQPFVNAVEEAGLRGVAFKRVWTDAPES